MKYGGYTKDWIISNYRDSKHKVQQVEILAELTESDEATIIEILKDANVLEGEYKTCNTCGRRYVGEHLRGHSNKCPECRKAESEYYKKRSKFKKNMEKIKALNDENLLLINELETLKRRIR